MTGRAQKRAEETGNNARSYLLRRHECSVEWTARITEVFSQGFQDVVGNGRGSLKRDVDLNEVSKGLGCLDTFLPSLVLFTETDEGRQCLLYAYNISNQLFVLIKCTVQNCILSLFVIAYLNI